MALRVYNTLTREKEDFSPLREGHVGIYLCGPTVYKPPHLGHLVGPVIFDTIKRYLTFKGYQVNWVVNVTDVDDKIIAEAEKRGLTFKALAEEQTELYLGVLAQLDVRQSIDHLPRASEHMNEMVSMIETLITKGHAYATEGGDVWFAVGSDDDYGKLSNRKLADAEVGLRDLAGGGKKSPADFALWKAAKPGEPSWPSPWGNGRPGWHIECSAMSAKYLGETFDIHGGGDDLKFPHHENELAQSECCTGKPFVKYWMHNGLTKVKTKATSGEWKSEKMSKSLGNVIDAQTLLKDHGPDVLRYLLLSTHYRSPIEFSDEALAICKKSVIDFGRLKQLRDQARKTAAGDVPADMVASIEQLSNDFVATMDDDFNTGGAIGVLNKLANLARPLTAAPTPANNASFVAIVDQLDTLAKLLGLQFNPPPAASVDDLNDQLAALNAKLGLQQTDEGTAWPDNAEARIEYFIAQRASAKKAKDFATADAIRKGLAELTITLEDKKDGTIWRKE